VKIVLFVHSVVSDWNNGHAHFLRGLMSALMGDGHEVTACEVRRNWSTENLFQDHGTAPIVELARRFPQIRFELYEGGAELLTEVERLTRGAELVIVHEFNLPELVGAVGHVRRRRGDFVLLFHDTHHRAVSAPEQIARLNLAHYDGVLAFGRSLAQVYRSEFAIERVWVFHEAADTSVFRPQPAEKAQDLVWIGNWGDDERAEELRGFLIEPALAMPQLRFLVHGVRYPHHAVEELQRAGIGYRSWLPNWRVPAVLAASRMTVHIPRCWYRTALPGIPTIRPFEALACGTPLICAGWEDREGLFRPGRDYIEVESPEEMRRAVARLARDPDACAALAASGLETILAHHTCAHRAGQLIEIHRKLGCAGA
jgi:spore maturation protein CgeB